jgi:hypothetical protein
MDISLILSVNFPDSIWTLNADDYEQLVWLSDSPKPTLEELESLWDETKAQVEAVQESKAQARASALAKLSAIGLTQEEIEAL